MNQFQFKAVPCLALLCALVLINHSMSGRTATAADPKPLEIGKPAPNFELPGVDGKTYRLADFDNAKLLVVVFTCNHCPTAQAYDDRIIQLDRDFKNRGVALVAISPNDPKALRLDESISIQCFSLLGAIVLSRAGRPKHWRADGNGGRPQTVGNW